MYSGDTTAVQSLGCMGQNLASKGHLIIILTTTSIRVDLQSDALSFTVPALVNNTWYWIWTEYTAGTKSSRLYVNNVESSSGSQAHTGNSNLTFGVINVGADQANGNLAPANSNFDDFRIWSGVTSASDRLTLYQAGLNSIKAGFPALII